jgi:hypothetical protein
MIAYAQQELALAAIVKERLYQDRKYGTLHERGLSVGDYLVILRRELTEAEQAFVSAPLPESEALREILQVAAVAVAALERHGVVERES